MNFIFQPETFDYIHQRAREHDWMWAFMFLSIGVHTLSLVWLGWLTLKVEKKS